MTEVLKGAASGAIIGAVDAGAKVAGFGDEIKPKAAASKLADAVVSKPKSSDSNSRTAANKKTKNGK